MSLVPTRKNVLIAQVSRKTVSSGGIFIEGVRSVADTETGRVIEVGPEVTLVVIGDEVLLDWSKAQVVSVDGEQRVIINENEIIGVIER